MQRIVHKTDLDSWIIINKEHQRLLESSIIMHKKASDTGGIWRSIGGSLSARPVIGNIFLQEHEELSDCQL